MRILYTGRAGNDLDIALEWYECQRRGLGFEFDTMGCRIRQRELIVA